MSEKKSNWSAVPSALSALLAFACLLPLILPIRAGAVELTDDNPMSMPSPGTGGLKVIAPNILELTYISTKQPDPAPLTEWNFVPPNLPQPSAFSITSGSRTLTVQSVGFKRRALYAPLKQRDLRVINQLYLQLSSNVAASDAVEVLNPNGALWNSTVIFKATADPLRLSPAIHVNQEGYMPGNVKKAMVGYYLGSLGEMKPSALTTFSLVKAATGETVYQGALTSRKDVGFAFSPLPYQNVLEADFSSVVIPGEYKLVVDGLGASFPFFIDEGIAAGFARTYALGLYHQRCGTDNALPFTRFTHGVCHTNLAEIPDMTFTAVNEELGNMSSDYASNPRHTAPQLKDVNSSLYPFINQGKIDVSGGHHDAGDYSKYTINVAQLVHSLIFAVDSLPGVADLDNLGLPQSGDGISDVMQEAKWEADFLAKLQDADGGFYFLVYPRNREYEADVTPDFGDSQIVFPKNTSATAAAAAALAQMASSPRFKQAYPEVAAAYLNKAKQAWVFLQQAIAKYGRDGAYQKITHYGDEFMHDDELAWAATELYLATGDPAYHQDLVAHFDPSDPNTRRWTWWRLFEGYGCAVRSYAFAVQSGRVSLTQLDPAFLLKCQNEIIAAGDDALRFSQENAYGSSFPDPSKANRSAGWYFSVEQTFNIATAYQLLPKQDYIDAIVANMNYEAGCNPLNIPFLTGMGWKRWRETVNQYAQNDRRVLPPSGIPLGNMQDTYTYTETYQGELSTIAYPADKAGSAPFAPYETWSDAYNTETEFVNPQQGRSLASMAFMMARTSLKTQAWKSQAGSIQGLPTTIPAQQSLAATLSAPGIDLSKARLTWEARDTEPSPSSTFSFAAASLGTQWIEAEALLPDGRRIFAVSNFVATTSLSTPPNSFQSTALAPSSDMIALYHLDSNLQDATGKEPALALQGAASLDVSNLGWLSNRSGSALHFSDLGDKATVSIPNSDLFNANSGPITIEAMIYITQFKAYNRANALLFSLRKNDWNALLEFGEDAYAGPIFRGNGEVAVTGAQISGPLTLGTWHNLRLRMDGSTYSMYVDGNLVASAANTQWSNWSGDGTTVLEVGNFDGWMDEIVIRNGQNSTSVGIPQPPPPPVILPDGGTFQSAAMVTLSNANAQAAIRYTTDGSDPGPASTLYVTPLAVSSSTIIKAKAFGAASGESTISAASFVIQTATQAHATFVKADTTTGGNWKTHYGAEGFSIIGNMLQYPAYAQVTPADESDYAWSNPGADPTVLQRGDSSDRTASCWYSPTQFTVHINLTDGKTHRLAFYCLDYTSTDRAQNIEVLDRATGIVLDGRAVSRFTTGDYLIWDVSGDVVVRFTRTAGANTVLMGIFFDAIPGAIPAPVAVHPQKSAGHFSLKVQGATGQAFVIQTSLDLKSWTSVSTNVLSGPLMDISDPSNTGFAQQFYRAVLPTQSPIQ